MTTTLEKEGYTTSLIAPRRKIYIALENAPINFEFTREETLKVGRLVAKGATLADIESVAEKVGRPQEEVLLLMLDRMEVGPLKGEKDKGWSKCIALENVEVGWFWDMEEVYAVEWLHKAGESIFNIAKKLNRQLIDVVVLIVDRGLRGKLG